MVHSVCRRSGAPGAPEPMRASSALQLRRAVLSAASHASSLSTASSVSPCPTAGFRTQ